MVEVMAMDDDRLPGDVNELLDAPDDKKFYILDGQHRIEVLRKAIELDIAQERQRVGIAMEVTKEDVDMDPRACWPAHIYYRGAYRLQLK